ncbi:MAG TPA: anthranilate phosphoribosyltransferase [Prolixibacteraceae bacterium]|nr:anthranilate phosphoribosyltransferase [Prolixibacteraceae bacterium]
MKEILQYLFKGNKLTTEQAEEILLKIGQDHYSEIEISSFLTVFLMRPINADELKGFRNALLKLAVPVDLSEFNTIDVCGTGGDEKNTFNISTLTAFVLAGAGYKVSKHGNYGVSSSCGSSNLLEYFGYKFSNNESKLKSEIEKTGITFLHAPLFHPAMKYVAPVRRTLKVKTFFNKLGPMVNPSSPKNQLVGVYDMNVLELYKKVYEDQKANYTILHSLDGYDEISLTGEIAYVSNLGEGRLTPADFGFEPLSPAELYGGETVEEAAKTFINVLENKATIAQTNAVLANTAMGIKIILPEKDLKECVEIAKNSVHSGKALQAFQTLIKRQ